MIVDGSQMFARPGPRLVDALEFLVGLLHNKPELIPQDFPWQYWPSCTPADSISPGSSPTELELPLGSATDNDLPSVSATAASGSDGLSSGIPNSRTSVSEAAGDQTQDGGEVKSTTDSLSTDHAKASRSVNGNSSGSARFRSIADGVTTTKASSASPQRVTAAVSEDTEKAQAEWLDDNAGGQTHGHEAAAVSSASLSNGAVSGVNEVTSGGNGCEQPMCRQAALSASMSAVLC